MMAVLYFRYKSYSQLDVSGSKAISEPSPLVEERVGLETNLPVGTKSIPFAIDGPTGAIGASTLNSHSLLPVCLSRARIMPDFIFPSYGI